MFHRLLLVGVIVLAIVGQQLTMAFKLQRSTYSGRASLKIFGVTNKGEAGEKDDLSTTPKMKLFLDPIIKIAGEITLPGSKSLSNRVLLLSALSKGTTKVENLLDSADIRYMLAGLKQLNIPIDEDKEKKTAIVTGRGGTIDVTKEELFLGNAGTAMRPLAGVLCAGQGQFVLDGTPRMRERPIDDLVDGLKQLGVDITCSDTGCPPVKINAKGIKGGEAVISGQISSQFLSALLMTAPLAKGDVTIRIKVGRYSVAEGVYGGHLLTAAQLLPQWTSYCSCHERKHCTAILNRPYSVEPSCLSFPTPPPPSTTSPHLTSPHLTSPHLTSPHLTLPHLTSPHPTLIPPHLVSPIPHSPLRRSSPHPFRTS